MYKNERVRGMKMSICAKETNGLKRSGMELEAVMDQRNKTGKLWYCRREVLSYKCVCGWSNRMKDNTYHTKLIYSV